MPCSLGKGFMRVLIRLATTATESDGVYKRSFKMRPLQVLSIELIWVPRDFAMTRMASVQGMG